MSKPCTDHMKFPTAAAAEAYRQELIARAKCTGEGGTSWKRLVVFRCRSHFHVGTNRKTFIQTEPTQSVLPDLVAPQTPEEVQRRNVYMDLNAKRHFLRRAEYYRKLAKAGGPLSEYHDCMYRSMLTAVEDLFGPPAGK